MQENAFKILIIVVCLLFPYLSATMAMAQESTKGAPTGGSVYLMTNKADDNTIILLERSADGTLIFRNETSTRGRGSGPGVLLLFFRPAPLPIRCNHRILLL